MSDCEEIMKRIQTQKGVIGVIVVNAEGIPVRTTLDNSTTVTYAQQVSNLASRARSCVRDMDPQNDLTFLRIRSKKHEIMVAPGDNYKLSCGESLKSVLWGSQLPQKRDILCHTKERILFDCHPEPM